MSDLDLMFAALHRPPRRPAVSLPPHCNPDRDNLALITSMAIYARDALSGAPEAEVARRRAHLRACIDAAKQSGMLYTVADPVLDAMIAAVDAAAAERRFTVAADAFAQAPAELPLQPTSGQVAAGLRAGARSRKAAARIWQAMAGALGGAPK